MGTVYEYIKRAAEYAEQENFKAALKEIKKALKIEPRNASLQYNLANCLESLGKTKKAISIYKKSLSLDQKKECASVTRYQLGKIYLSKEKFDEAITQFREAVEDVQSLATNEKQKRGVTANCYFALGRTYFRKAHQKKYYGGEESDLEKSRESFERALRINPNLSPSKELEWVKGEIEHGWFLGDGKGNIIKSFPGRGE